MTTAPQAECRWCHILIVWDDLYGWLKAGWTPSAKSGQCDIGPSSAPPMGTGPHTPKEDR